MSRLKTNYRKAEDSPGFVLWKAANLLQRKHSQCLNGLNITPSEFSLMTSLVYLSEQGPSKASQIVAHTGMDKMHVSDLVKALIRKQLVRKMPDPSDGRAFLLAPTLEGETKTNSAVKKIEALDAEFFKKVRNVTAFHRELLSLIESKD